MELLPYHVLRRTKGTANSASHIRWKIVPPMETGNHGTVAVS